MDSIAPDEKVLGGPFDPQTQALESAIEDGVASPSAEMDAMQTYQGHLRQLFDELSHQNLGYRDGYDRVGVLLIRWADELDTLHVANEVRELAEVFEKVYNFDIRHLILHDKTMPQHQLNLAMTQFVSDHDTPDTRNLIITYYAGHGGWDEDEKHFYLEATTKIKEGKRRKGGVYQANASWNKAEQSLWDSESDVLAIFDACLADKLLHRNSRRDSKSYEVLCATASHLTEGPGQHSFTAALTKTLKALPDDMVRGQKRGSFTTQMLYQRIAMHRSSNKPFWWYRSQSDNSPIRLGPVTTQTSPRAMTGPSRKQIDEDATDLTLRFRLRGKPELTEEEVDALTQGIPKAFQEADIICDRITLVSHCTNKDSRLVEDVLARVVRTKRMFRHWSSVGRKRKSVAFNTGTDDAEPSILNALGIDSSIMGPVASPSEEPYQLPIVDNMEPLTPLPRPVTKPRSRAG